MLLCPLIAEHCRHALSKKLQTVLCDNVTVTVTRAKHSALWLFWFFPVVTDNERLTQSISTVPNQSTRSVVLTSLHKNAGPSNVKKNTTAHEYERVIKRCVTCETAFFCDNVNPVYTQHTALAAPPAYDRRRRPATAATAPARRNQATGSGVVALSLRVLSASMQPYASDGGGGAAKRRRSPTHDAWDDPPRAAPRTTWPYVTAESEMRNPIGFGLYFDAATPPVLRIPVPPRASPVRVVSEHGLPMTAADRLRMAGAGMRCRLGRQLATTLDSQVQRFISVRDRQKMMRMAVRRVASGRLHAVLQASLAAAHALLSEFEYDAAAAALVRPINMGHLPSRAHLVSMHLDRREGVTPGSVTQRKSMDALVAEGAQRGCAHCQGVRAHAHRVRCASTANPAELDIDIEWAIRSAANGSMYGQCLLGIAYTFSWTFAGNNFHAGPPLFRMAADQGYDVAQYYLGWMYSVGAVVGVNAAQGNFVTALQWYRRSAAQGNVEAMLKIGESYEFGRGVAVNIACAIAWYRRAARQGCRESSIALKRLYDVVMLD